VPSPPCLAPRSCLRNSWKPNPNSPRARHRTHWVGRLRTSFSPLELHEDEPRWIERLSRPWPEAAYQRHVARGTHRARVSRRLLQPKQPTSTTTNHPNPGRDYRRDASSSRWTWRKPSGRGWGPVRLVDRRFRAASPLSPTPRPCGLGKGFCATPAELLRTRGLSDERRNLSPSMTDVPKDIPRSTEAKRDACAKRRLRAPCWLRTLRESATQARSARAPPVTEPPRCQLERLTSPFAGWLPSPAGPKPDCDTTAPPRKS
jgi:hypothetical protein